MRVLMLGWEFPPFISGGLGTACFGLTKALSAQQVRVTFVLPKPVAGAPSQHVRLLAPRSAAQAAFAGRMGVRDAQGEIVAPVLPFESAEDENAPFANVKFRTIAARLGSPYQSAGGHLSTPPHAHANPGDPAASTGDPNRPLSVLAGPGAPASSGAGFASVGNGAATATGPGGLYAGDLLAETHRYAQLCARLARSEDFDLVHAHDWMTFPAGLAVAAATGKPLVVHVHSTEFDRAGESPNQQVYDIERRGMHGALKVIAVSHLTKSIVEHRYGVDPDKIHVVYNGIDNGKAEPHARSAIKRGDKIVLFLGRITMQKGPEYFVNAAKKVLEKYDRVKFVMAGSGDKIKDIIELAAAHGIGHKVLFTGFLRGRDVERVFKMADVYVMPSVSEPFGIAPLEAIAHDVPVIISKTSGVSEVLTHALKVDFWDTHEIANKIIAVLKYPPLSQTLREHADIEVRRLSWSDAAHKTRAVYRMALGMAVGVG